MLNSCGLLHCTDFSSSILVLQWIKKLSLIFIPCFVKYSAERRPLGIFYILFASAGVNTNNERFKCSHSNWGFWVNSIPLFDFRDISERGHIFNLGFVQNYNPILKFKWLCKFEIDIKDWILGRVQVVESKWEIFEHLDKFEPVTIIEKRKLSWALILFSQEIIHNLY